LPELLPARGTSGSEGPALGLGELLRRLREIGGVEPAWTERIGSARRAVRSARWSEEEKDRGREVEREEDRASGLIEFLEGEVMLCAIYVSVCPS
jgi:hypothetical protein